ncbi:MAG: N-acetyl-gamma-glutamyl-phosphate reductase [Candidatus Eisenbacteria bacterium]|nr:N-acetyl-gamma-glutamyl-phosphate reductase [Candidatus Eisenbacteria bacterium]
MTPLTGITAPAGGRAKTGAPSAIARIAVLGASGYSGQEFARLALDHPGLALAALVSREQAGRPAADLLPGVDPRAATLPAVVAPAALPALLEAGAFDTLVCCLPHGVWAGLAAEHPALAKDPRRIVDVSSDFRAAAFDGGSDYVYGLPEAFREAIPGATRIANPGCYPTAALLALLPVAEARRLAGPVSITALSGVSGAGRSPALKTSFVELEGGASIYKAGTAHPHVPEMERALARVAGDAIPVGFVPQLVPMARGILLTATATLAHAVTPEAIHAAYAERYAGEPFVRVLAPGVWPETRAVRGSNRCDLAVTTLHDGRTLLATAAIDNLVKGAAGQAIQNLNLMLGWPETTGLPPHGSPW